MTILNVRLVLFVAIICSLKSTLAASENEWSRSDLTYFSRDTKLENHTYAEHTTSYLLTQCARWCLMDQRCKSYNFRKERHFCQLNDADHRGFPHDVISEEGVEYFDRDAFRIDKAAMGVCSQDPCHGNGRCVDLNTPAEFLCICKRGWEGKNCTDKYVVAWSAWEPWQPCSVSCGEGWQKRQRHCADSRNISVRSETCYGGDVEIRSCSSGSCPAWTFWNEWSSCSTHRTCGRGVKSRSRECTNGGRIGVDSGCYGNTVERSPCDEPGCDALIRLTDGETFGEGTVNIYDEARGEWAAICGQDWDVTDASVLCWQLGFDGATEGGVAAASSRLTLLTKVNCTGNELSLTSCLHAGWGAQCGVDEGYAYARCKVHGDWNTWESWSQCSASCSNGTKVRRRKCDYPPALRGGRSCTGVNIESTMCVGPPCPVHGAWDTWSKWTTCNATCGGGNQRRHRECIDPKHGGMDCIGNSTETRPCNEQHCPVNGAWNVWTSWSNCNITCGGGYQHRSRSCNGPHYGGKECEGQATETQLCNDQHCPVDGVWEVWSSWTVCSTSCGGGKQNRTRTCNGPHYGGLDCYGQPEEIRACNTDFCPVFVRANVEKPVMALLAFDAGNKVCSDGLWKGNPTSRPPTIDGMWSAWSNYSICSTLCGGGTQHKSRHCIGPFHGGANCTGNSTSAQSCNTHKCPIDGVWYSWSPWSNCSLACGGGNQTRQRVCDGPYFGGTNCSGEAVQRRSCNSHLCPVDGFWRSWSIWGTCSASCGGGVHYRYRSCDGPYHGGQSCVGNTTDSRECNELNCPVDGMWNQWQDWSECSASCGNGTRSRRRTCHGPLYGGANCTGSDVTAESCHKIPCPVDGVWKDWSDWFACNASCGGGSQVRLRSCDSGRHGGQNCSGHSFDYRECNLQHCPVDGVWLEWTSWANCSATCGGGVLTRRRTCEGPYYGGENCTGNSLDVRNCSIHYCPVDGAWVTWSEWSSCSSSCGNGSVIRNRTCSGPFFGGRPCSGYENQTETCNLRECPVDGVWRAWSNWTGCSKSCGGGQKVRSRYCNKPLYGGQNCTGNAQEIKICNANVCPVDGVWLSWSQWTECNVTCGGGGQWRNRTCRGPLHGGKACEGSVIELKECAQSFCPIDGYYESWSAWSSCNASCGGGSTTRSRACVPPMNNGKPCDGQSFESNFCNGNPCPVDGQWNLWSRWSHCNATCGGGGRTRYRICGGTAFGGKSCPGHGEDFEECNAQHCPVDGVFEDWSSWSNCSVSCGGGWRFRHRGCKGPFYGGVECQGEHNETSVCNDHNCPVDGLFGEWTVWKSCNASCGGGFQWRFRMCKQPQHGGRRCQGVNNESRTCNSQNCPIDGVFDTWGQWTVCSTSCGEGHQIRNRTCLGPLYNGNDCNGTRNETRICHERHCPVDGHFNEWSGWGDCSATCGGGAQIRTRSCVGPFYGGLNCNGTVNVSKSCNEHNCPVDGVWKSWSDWGTCDVTCGGGVQHRSRLCDGPFYGGLNCSRSREETRVCSNTSCPVDGYYDSWQKWGRCDVSCGGGHRERNRTCIGPHFGGEPCKGNATESEGCNRQPCPVDGIYLPWSPWASCSVTCGDGMQARNRTCHGPFHGGKECEQKTTESRVCNVTPCPVNGVFTTWSEWAQCSRTCGGGIETRHRQCHGPFYGGQDCHGEFNESRSCNFHECPVDGVWNDWSRWSDCSVSCGGGIWNRSRACYGPFYNGNDCEGAASEQQVCNENPCPIPGEWLEWGSWQECSKTCGGGVQIRTRECNLTTHGILTAPCLHNSTQSMPCSIYSCTLPRTCREWYARGKTNSGYTEIDPDMEGPLKPFAAYCDMSNDQGITIVEHNHEQPIEVKEHEGMGEFVLSIAYKNTLAGYPGIKQVAALVDASLECSQSLRWDCRSATMHNKFGAVTFWMNRDQIEQFYWAGGNKATGGCACSLTGDCYGGHLCNCDANDEIWRFDEGNITSKKDLPVTTVLAGDTGGYPEEEGKLTIGPLICKGVLN